MNASMLPVTPMQRRVPVFTLRLMAAIAAITAGLLMQVNRAAAEYPERPIQFIVPFAPGGATERVARIVADKMREELGQPVLVVNHAGGGTVIGTGMVARARPDGYTLLLGSNSLVLVPLLRPEQAEMFRDFAPVGYMARQPFVLVVHPSVAANTLQDLLNIAKAKPGEINFATAGAGTGNHLATEQFIMMSGAKITHIPYQGTGPAMVDLLAGRVQMTITAVSIVLPNIQAGKLRALGVGDLQRVPDLPNVPTISEAGVPGYDSTSWNGMLVRSGTPRDIVVRLNAVLNKGLNDPAVRKAMVATGAIAEASTPEEFGAFIARQQELWKKVIASAGIKAE